MPYQAHGACVGTAHVLWTQRGLTTHVSLYPHACLGLSTDTLSTAGASCHLPCWYSCHLARCILKRQAEVSGKHEGQRSLARHMHIQRAHERWSMHTMLLGASGAHLESGEPGHNDAGIYRHWSAVMPAIMTMPLPEQRSP